MDGVAMAMTLHLVQVIWAIIAATLPIVWKAAPGPTDPDGLPAES